MVTSTSRRARGLACAWVFSALLHLLPALLQAETTPTYVTFPSDVDWVTRTSAHFEAIYRRGNDRFAERSLFAAEKAYRLLSPIFPSIPRKTYIVLADFVDS